MPWPTIVWPRCFRNRAGRPPGGTGIGPCRQRPPHDVLSSQDSASADSLKPVRENGGGARRFVPPLARFSGMPSARALRRTPHRRRLVPATLATVPHPSNLRSRSRRRARQQDRTACHHTLHAIHPTFLPAPCQRFRSISPPHSIAPVCTQLRCIFLKKKERPVFADGPPVAILLARVFLNLDEEGQEEEHDQSQESPAANRPCGLPVHPGLQFALFLLIQGI